MADKDTPEADEAASAGHDYRDTLFLPKTEFPMRGGLPKAEPEWIAKWDEMGLYERLRETAKTVRNSFIMMALPMRTGISTSGQR